MALLYCQSSFHLHVDERNRLKSNGYNVINYPDFHRYQQIAVRREHFHRKSLQRFPRLTSFLNHHMSTPLSQLGSLAGFDGTRIYSELLFTALLVWYCLAPLPHMFNRLRRHCITPFIGFMLMHLTIPPYYKTIAAQIVSLYDYIMSTCSDITSTFDLQSTSSQLSFVAVVLTFVFCLGADHFKCALNRLPPAK